MEANDKVLNATTAKGRPSDEDIINYENRIREEQVNVHPLISTSLPVNILCDEYIHSPNPNFMRKVNELSHQFAYLRRSRGDGNCFFRAFSYGFVEAVHQLPEPQRRLFISDLRLHLGEKLRAAGFDSMAYEDFFEELFAALEDPLVDINSDYLADLWAVEAHRSHSLVVVLRLATSAYLRLNAEAYEPFLWEMASNPTISNPNVAEDGLSMTQYCQRYVECLGVESDQIHAIALGKILGVDICIIYLDGSEGPISQLLFSAFEGKVAPLRITLLYRPGHYDLLYVRQDQIDRPELQNQQ